MKKVTFVIAVYEDTKTLRDTVVNIISTVNPNEIDIIVIDDGNSVPDDEFMGFPCVSLYHNEARCGVGYSLDIGVNMAKTDIVFIMGCDIRFSLNWFNRFYDIVASNPESIICTKVSGLEETPTKARKFLIGKENYFYGSHILYEITKENNGKENPVFRKFIEAKWNKPMPGDVEEIGCVLGAFYGCHKSWYKKIRGFEGHRTWGTLEPLISLRSYLNGGNCLIDLNTTTGHIFKSSSSIKPISDILYNKLLVAYTLFPVEMEKEIYEWVAPIVDRDVKCGEIAIQQAKENQSVFDDLRTLKNSISEKELIKRISKMNPSIKERVLLFN